MVTEPEPLDGEETANEMRCWSFERISVERCFHPGTFGEQGARAILENAAAYRHLEELDRTHHYVGEELAAELAKIGPHVILAQPQSAADDDGEEHRYVQISE